MRDVKRMKKNEQFSTHLGFQEHSPLGFSLHDPIQCFEIPPCSVPSRSSAAHQCWLQGHGRRAQERWSSLVVACFGHRHCPHAGGDLSTDSFLLGSSSPSRNQDDSAT